VLLFALILVGAILVFKKIKKINAQLEVTNAAIQQKNHLLVEQKKEILDSITYAKRIQSAILAPLRIVKQSLPDSFILYKPKDIVAGDFYWFEKNGDEILFAAADCTGHGVPGAMVSVVCNNGLNRSVREYGLNDPGKILDKTREIIIQEFEKSDEEVKDGMDISLCILNTRTNSLKWAGANNPLWIIRSEGNLEEVKPNKQPIGKYAEANAFTTHTKQLNKGDCLYVFTDGFQDQFGGVNGKKYKSSKMKELFLSIHTKNMEQQFTVIQQAFEDWKGSLEQVDDVCVMGVRI
jgi:serine phosphatase RsbU (regulator of sigma subunit)